MRCPNCGSGKIYLSSYCNFAHCVECGAACDPEHECDVPLDLLKDEYAGRCVKVIRDASMGWPPSYYLIDGDKLVEVPWEAGRGLRVGALFEHPQTGERLRLGEIEEV